MDRGHVKISYNGPRNIPVTIGLGIEIEEETGLGLVELVRQLQAGSVKTSVASKVVRLGLAKNGQIFTDDEWSDMLEREGIMPTVKAAAEIVGALFRKPAKANGAAGKALAAPAATN